MNFMTAVVIRKAGGPGVLNLERIPVPAPKPGWVLIRVRAFGLNRSELFTRQGHSPNVAFPRVLGIEAVGEVVAAPDGGFSAMLPAGVQNGACARRVQVDFRRTRPDRQVDLAPLSLGNSTTTSRSSAAWLEVSDDHAARTNGNT